MEHPDIDRIQRLGYPSQEYLDFEREKELERGDVDEDGTRITRLQQQTG